MPADQVDQPARPLSPGEVAALLGVSVSTVADWADQGVLAHFKTVGGHRRFRREDVERFKAQGAA